MEATLIEAPPTQTVAAPPPQVEAHKRYPIAEHFVSPQGEGRWSGVTHCFVRFAGCTVGKPYTAAERQVFAHVANPLQIYQEKCTAWNGQNFPCDTNYRMASRMTVEEIMALIPANVKHVCLTGGEPLMHDLMPLMLALRDANKYVHIETSGTIDFRAFEWRKRSFGWWGELPWIAVSPKGGYIVDLLPAASELKVLVGDGFDEAAFFEAFSELIAMDRVYIQPINDEYNLIGDHVQRCLTLQQRYPQLMLSLQIHKLLNVR